MAAAKAVTPVGTRMRVTGLGNSNHGTAEEPVPVRTINLAPVNAEGEPTGPWRSIEVTTGPGAAPFALEQEVIVNIEPA